MTSDKKSYILLNIDRKEKRKNPLLEVVGLREILYRLEDTCLLYHVKIHITIGEFFMNFIETLISSFKLMMLVGFWLFIIGLVLFVITHFILNVTQGINIKETIKFIIE